LPAPGAPAEPARHRHRPARPRREHPDRALRRRSGTPRLRGQRRRRRARRSAAAGARAHGDRHHLRRDGLPAGHGLPQLAAQPRRRRRGRRRGPPRGGGAGRGGPQLMEALTTLPILLPLLGAAASIGVGRWRNAQRIIGIVVLSAVTAISAVALLRVDRDGMTAVAIGDWGAPVGITLVADRLALLVLVAAMVMLLA